MVFFEGNHIGNNFQIINNMHTKNEKYYIMKFFLNYKFLIEGNFEDFLTLKRTKVTIIFYNKFLIFIVNLLSFY